MRPQPIAKSSHGKWLTPQLIQDQEFLASLLPFRNNCRGSSLTLELAMRLVKPHYKCFTIQLAPLPLVPSEGNCTQICLRVYCQAGNQATAIQANTDYLDREQDLDLLLASWNIAGYGATPPRKQNNPAFAQDQKGAWEIETACPSQWCPMLPYKITQQGLKEAECTLWVTVMECVLR